MHLVLIPLQRACVTAPTFCAVPERAPALSRNHAAHIAASRSVGCRRLASPRLGASPSWRLECSINARLHPPLPPSSCLDLFSSSFRGASRSARRCGTVARVARFLRSAVETRGPKKRMQRRSHSCHLLAATSRIVLNIRIILSRR